MTRQVKLGRKALVPLAAFHWATKAGDTWYEVAVDGDKTQCTDCINLKINRSKGYAAMSGAGSFGGELAGETDKTDAEIDEWVDAWVTEYRKYELTTINCQKFAWEFLDWLTDGNFICPHRFDAADHCIIKGIGATPNELKTFVRAEEGNAIARVSHGGKSLRCSRGIFHYGVTSAEAKVQAVAGPGLGAWADVSLGKAEANVSNIVGVHVNPNINTGAGIRNGNLEAHLLGFGGRVGSDGLTLDTPIVGVSACSVM